MHNQTFCKMTGPELKKFIDEKGVNVSQFAISIGTTKQNVSQKFKAKKNVNKEFLLQLAKYLKQPLSFVTGNPRDDVQYLLSDTSPGVNEPVSSYGRDFQSLYIRCNDEKDRLNARIIELMEEIAVLKSNQSTK